jgi:hypothetical protein
MGGGGDDDDVLQVDDVMPRRECCLRVAYQEDYTQRYWSGTPA